MTSTPGTVELRNNALLSPNAPDPLNPSRVPGELWVNSDNLTLYVFSNDMDGDGTKGWIGVTSGQNTGSIIYSGDTPPTLNDIYPNLEQYSTTIPLDPLPGTVWYDTNNSMLKVYYVQTNPVNDPDVQDAYTGQWVSVTTAHYLTEATASKINDLQTQVDTLTDTVAQLESIINP